MVELVLLRHGVFQLIPQPSVEEAAINVYNMFMQDAEICECVHAIREDGVDLWKPLGQSSMSTLFKLIYPEGIEKKSRRTMI